MPSQTFLNLANSQFELLANSLFHSGNSNAERKSKIKSIALYLPQENPKTGQLEFLPSVIYPCPSLERIFIASDADSGLAPLLPPTLTKLPGFANAQTLIPTYPFASSSTDAGRGACSAGIGTPEEIMCDISSTDPKSGAALSLPIFSGHHTIGVILIWPTSIGSTSEQDINRIKRSSRSKRKKRRQRSWSLWTREDKQQISRAGESIALALCMDTERFQAQMQTEEFSVALADSLHQVKNPLQAMRTFAKLLQRDLAQQREDSKFSSSKVEMLLSNMIDQSDRVADLLLPMDSILNILQEEAGQVENREQEQMCRLREGDQKLLLQPGKRNDLVLRQPQTKTENDNSQSLGFQNATIISYSDQHEENQTNNSPIEMAFLTDVLDSTISAAMAVAADQGIAFHIYGMNDEVDLPGVSIHPRSLQEAVSNILYNAINYVKFKNESPKRIIPNPSPEIRVTLLPNDYSTYKPGVTIWVEDNGPGIPHGERKQIFQRGFRGKATKHHSKGSGIGLSISKSLISNMGGILEIVDNDPRHLKGAVLRIVLFREP